jgi:hypothetical protein
VKRRFIEKRVSVVLVVVVVYKGSLVVELIFAGWKRLTCP